MKPGVLHFEVTGHWADRRSVSLPASRRISIGRQDGSDIQLFASQVSRKHAFVEWTPDGLRVTDTSRNGTLANGVPLRRVSRVFSEQRVALVLWHTCIEISFEETDAEAPPRTPSPEVPNQSEVRRASTAPPPDSKPPA